MSATTTRLAEVLLRQADLYENLLGLLEEEEAALIAGDTRAVGECLVRSENLVLQLRLLETSREALVTQLTGRRTARLAELPDTDTGTLGRARSRLEAVLPRVERTNRRVKALLERGLKLFDVTLDLVRGAAGLGRHYTATGTLAPIAVPMIDGRA
jgi:flagellar biosynthesis/type III secretory pathway chaperone